MLVFLYLVMLPQFMFLKSLKADQQLDNSIEYFAFALAKTFASHKNLRHCNLGKNSFCLCVCHAST